MIDMPSESIIMPHVPTPVIGTRPRLGFSIESLVGNNNNNTDITSPSSLSPPLSGMTKLPDSPIATDNSQFIFSPKDLFMQAREQQIKEQFLRTQIFREQIAREQITREQITRDQITREQITREQLLRGQMQAQHEQQKLILRDESASREIREFENRLLGSPGTPTRSVSPSSHYEEDAKKSSPPLALSPVQQSMLPQVFPGNMGMPFGSHILSMNNNNIFQPHLGAAPLLPSHPHILGRSIGHPLGLGTPLPPTQTSKEYPLYPWLMTAHQGRFFPQASDFPTFLLPFRKPKRIRTAFSPNQLLRLEQAFEKNQYVVGAERKQLAQTLSLSETQVKVWFQNRRTKHKRQQQEGDEGIEEGSKKRNSDESFILEHEEDEELDIENEAVGL